ncbi:MAG: cytochrome c oxidase subunit II [Pirellulales bacterium]|nr:cytochrome c oxidase subunit II [Pirellulales bacterium]
MISFAGLPLAQSGGFWLPDSATNSPAMDPVFYLILGICSFFFLLVVGLMVFFVVHYRRRPGVVPQKTASHNMLLELTWTFIPLVIVGAIFYQGFTAYIRMQTPPPNCYDLRVSARQWAWQFIYPNGHIDENLHVPVGEPIRLTMTSEDVIHGLWIPALRVKMDIVPGRYTSTWFRADKVGTYNLLCTEYCGDEHSDMLATVEVHTREDYDAWLKDAGNYLKTLPPAEAGKVLYQRRGCFQCHSVDGTAGTGPSFKGIYGETHDMADGTTAVVDDNYIRQSILEPQAKVRSGFQPVMATYQGLVSDDDITALIEYIKTLK